MSGNVSRLGLMMAATAQASVASAIGAVSPDFYDEPRAREARKTHRQPGKRTYAASDNGAKAVAKRLARMGK